MTKDEMFDVLAGLPVNTAFGRTPSGKWNIFGPDWYAEADSLEEAVQKYAAGQTTGEGGE